MPTDGLESVKVGRYRLVPVLRSLVDPKEEHIRLTNLEFRLLHLLMSSPGSHPRLYMGCPLGQPIFCGHCEYNGHLYAHRGQLDHPRPRLAHDLQDIEQPQWRQCLHLLHH